MAPLLKTPWPVRGLQRAFHVTAAARSRYGIATPWVSLRGNVLLADPERSLEVARRVAADPDPGRPTLSAADLYAGAVLDEVYHLLIARYLELVDRDALRSVGILARERMGQGMEALLEGFLRRYPPPWADAGQQPADLLAWQEDGVSGSEVATEELWTCYLADRNPALEAALPLVDLGPLRTEAPLEAFIDALRDHFRTAPGLPGAHLAAAPAAPRSQDAPLSAEPAVSLFELLLGPQLAHPHDLSAQLRFVRQRWGGFLGDDFAALLDGFLRTKAALVDTERRAAALAGPPPRPDPAGLLGDADAEARFSRDSDWMPSVVMVAKNAFVWLDQLARANGRPVQRLDQVPDEELQSLADRGFNALWLIGLWQRSEASRRIKRLRGQPDAEASAYALHDYAIAEELGGEAAYADLKERAGRVGLRLATDMVPNHVGLDGRWVVEHPERFVQLDHPPYPSYRFEGPDLSSDPRVELRIEDHYYDGSDAAVVFELRDRASGRVRYLYHGNDGTAMPWNDTAQLDYLNAEVREAVLRTIVEVARRSPIIRFDAAMTLAKRHVRRLWYPPPGEGGGVPSRGVYGGMDDEAFERAMPDEFWRQVVERIAAEAPDTLLLAEAFWMMEGFFVRQLGMHRVYNSAFMHMLRDADNAGYRALLREAMAFDPRLLQRYVNFMSNPDEESAAEQFGDGDRYFAVATLMATLPGLPMFGHGQFEALREKYGMEFRRARLDETPDPASLARHQAEVAPLLRRRASFAGAEAFRLFDATDGGGRTDEDVYAYTNHGPDGASLVLVNHAARPARGTLRRSAPYRDPHSGEHHSEDLTEALRLPDGEGWYLEGTELLTGGSALFHAPQLHREGWRFDLGAYGRLVLVGLRPLFDHDGSLARRHQGGPGDEVRTDDAAAGRGLRSGRVGRSWRASRRRRRRHGPRLRGRP